jgi:acetyl-CoA acyltransferase 1
MAEDSPSRRLDTLRRQLVAAPAVVASHSNPASSPPSRISRRKNAYINMDDPIVVVSALRTPLCKAKRGGLASATPELLLSTVLKATVQQTGLDPSSIGDIVVGCAVGAFAEPRL